MATQAPAAFGPAPWLRALGVDGLYVLSCDDDRFAAYEARQDATRWPFGRPKVFFQAKDHDGVRGCRAGHRGILRAAGVEREQCVMVLEDDVVFRQNAPELLAVALQDLNRMSQSWDALWLGGLDGRHETGYYENFRVTTDLVRFWPVFSTHAYILRGPWLNAAARALEMTGPADVVLQQLLQPADVYTFHPAIAGQVAGHSDVNGEHRKERW